MSNTTSGCQATSSPSATCAARRSSICATRTMEVEMKGEMKRRHFFKGAIAGGAALGLASFEERILAEKLAAAAGGDSDPGVAGLPKGRIGDLEISRIFLGGNLIGGWAHSRDLIYVSKLIKSYHTEGKIFETLALAEQK